MTYYAELSMRFFSLAPEIARLQARLLEPPFRVISHVPDTGALIEFDENGLPAIQEIAAALDAPYYIWDKKRRVYAVTAMGIEPQKQKLGPGWKQKLLRGLRRGAEWSALDKRLCGSVVEPTLVPQGRVPLFWRYRRFMYIKPGRKYPFRYSLRSPRRSKKIPCRGYPLLVYLHGGAGLGVKGAEAVRDVALLPQLLLKKCHVLVPQWGAGPKFNTDEFTQGLWEAISRMPGVDRSRIYIAGTSLGGFGAIAECRRHPERYAACVPAVAALWILKFDRETADEYHCPLDGAAISLLAQTPMWLGWCRDEKDENEPLYEALKVRNADVRRTYIKRFRHNLAGPVFWLTRGWGKWLFGKQKL